MELMDIIVRLGMAVALGAAIGIDREIHDHPAGLRTHMLTALAASVFTLLALEFYDRARRDFGTGVPDPIRAIEAVTAGVAFLAAGSIIQSRGRVRGLTTGAAMWLAGAVGVACGAGYFTMAVVATVFAVLILTVVTWLEHLLGTRTPDDNADRSSTTPLDRASKHSGE